MEAKVPRPRGRPRKRKRPEDVIAEGYVKPANRGNRGPVELGHTAPVALLGRYVLKEFEETGVFLGKVVHYDTGLYRVDYEDGDCEDFESGELRGIIVGESYFDDELKARKRKLDELILRKSKKLEKKQDKKEVQLEKELNIADATAFHGLNGDIPDHGGMTQLEDHTDSSNNLGEFTDDTDTDLEAEITLPPPPELPPSSGTIGVPQESVSHLISVYGFLRSFSIQLYLSPFGLDDFVGALNCFVPNTLLEAIHVALMCALKRHLERLAQDDSELACECLRSLDWSLLDSLTWPVYLVQYFTAMGHVTGPHWKSFFEPLLNKEYYSLSVGMKLMILQFLCDDVLDALEVRAEIDAREETEFGADPDGTFMSIPEDGPRRVHPKYSKTSAYREREYIKLDVESHGSKPNAMLTSGTQIESSATYAELDANSDECRLCGMDGTLLCCDGCPSAYHTRCIGVIKTYIPEGPWYCPECTVNRIEPCIAVGTSLRGAEFFGMDQYEQIFLGTCNHLLVCRMFLNSDAYLKYYNANDILKVVEVLLASTQSSELYLGICRAILSYWGIPESFISAGTAVKDYCVKQSGVSMYLKSQATSHAVHTRGSRAGDNSYKGLCFKPQAYVNQYTNGEFAALAAAKLTALSSEEIHDHGPYNYANARKVASNNISLQLKAFSSVASRFFWPSPERKDILRERCGWCHSCKLSPSSRRGCMLNAAVTNATKGAAKILSNLSPPRSGKGCVCSIAMYMLYLEESLRGLVAGPFTSESYRNYWRNQLLEATSCRILKRLLLELGENIYSVALSGDWTKTTEDPFIEHSIIQTVIVNVGTTPKRGPGPKRQKRHSEALVEVCDGESFGWWRGGILSKHVLQKAVLPQSVVRKVACQGGTRKILGFTYPDGSEIPKRSRQLTWKAAVESSRNTSQLALQVRYLDMNLRWNDLIRPEQSTQDFKGPETDASIFRNATICDKQVLNCKVRYGIAFGNQKHLPSRVMKNVIEVEKNKDGKEKYWFSEARIPLYLIKEYEESLHEMMVPPLKKPMGKLSALQRRQLKAARRDIFSYLVCRRDKLEKCGCASCQLDVLLRDAVTCNSCQGYCHKGCSLSSNFMNGKIELVVTCKRCYLAKHRTQPEISPSAPVGKQQIFATTPSSKGSLLKASNQPSTSLGKQEICSGGKRATQSLSSSRKAHSKIKAWGIIWRKKNNEDTGIHFRQENLLLGGKSEDSERKLVCDLCQQPYNPELTYIHCETCKKWYHAKAVELEDSKIPEVVGFKCCKCRRIRSPECPFVDPKLREQRQRKKAMRIQKQCRENSGMSSDLGTKFQLGELNHASSFSMDNGFVQVQEEDPLLLSVSRVEQTEEKPLDVEQTVSGSGLQKLPVRRHVKHGDTLDGSNCEVRQGPKGVHSLPVTDWDGSSGGVVVDYGTINYEDMEFEPQTYFSLTELLLPSDDVGQRDGLDTERGGAFEDSYSQSCVVEECMPFAQSDGRDSKIPVESATKEALCQICFNGEPSPNVSCEACGFLIHCHCSPWEEESPLENGWRCGHCR